MNSNVAIAKSDDMMLLVMELMGEKEKNRFREWERCKSHIVAPSHSTKWTHKLTKTGNDDPVMARHFITLFYSPIDLGDCIQLNLQE